MRNDVLLNNNDLVVNNNDLVWVQSDNQHIEDTINASPGWWKENYQDGVGIIQYFKGRNVQQELSRSMKLQLQTDGYNSRPLINFDTSGNLTIDPNVSS